MIERKYLRPALACLGSTVFFIVIAKLNSLEYSTLGRPVPTANPTRQPILTPRPKGTELCPDGSLAVRNKTDAFCTQAQLTPIATPSR